MEQKRYPLKGGIFPLLAILLTVLALVGLISALQPKTALRRAVEESLAVLEERDETLIRLVTLLRQGKLSATENGKEQLTATGSEDVRALTLRGEKKWTLYRSGAELRLKPEEGETLGGTAAELRAYLAAAWENPEERMLLSAWAALSDGALTAESLCAEAESLWSAADLSLSREKTDFAHGEEEGSATCYRLTAEGETVAEAMAALSEAAATEAALSLLLSLAGAEAQNAALPAFFEGDGALFEALAGDGRITCDLTVFDGRLRRGEMTLQGKDAEIRLTLSLDGTDVGLTLSVTQGETAWSLAVTDTVTEDKNSYLRELSLCLTEAGESRESRLRFSWGKTKNDLALRYTLPHTEYYFRGTLEEKKKDRFVFTLSRIEKDKENLLPAPLQLTLTEEGESLPLPDRDGDFAEGLPS